MPDGMITDFAAAEKSLLLRIEEQARVLAALIAGEPGAWKLDGRKVTERTGDALISMNAYLNDLSYLREPEA